MKDKNKKPAICIVALNAYGMLTGAQSGFVGGAERQATMMARWFARNGYKVSVITWGKTNRGMPEVIDGILIYKTCDNKEGLPGLRFFYPRWYHLVRALRSANSDVYIQNCAEAETGQIALWCKLRKRKFIYFIASDMDCQTLLPDLKTLREKILYRYGIKHAEQIISQTNNQKLMLMQNFKVDSEQIPMPCKDISKAEINRHINEMQRRILWIGRVCEVKRPDRLIEVARLMDDLEFDFVGPYGTDSYSQKVIAEAGKLKNIKIHGRIAPDKVAEFYIKATILLCTSDFEGFPNTFLEAWSYGIPIVSMFDPDSLIEKYEMGIKVNSTNDAINGIKKLLVDKKLFENCSKNSRKYFYTYHCVDVVLPKIELLINCAK